MKKIIIEFIIIFTTLLLLFKYNIQIKNNLNVIFYVFAKNIIPTMFPIIFITKYIKYNVVSSKCNKYFRFINLLFSFAPNNAILSRSQNELLYSTIINPLFSYSILINHFSNKNTLIIILINLLINYILLLKNMSYLESNNTKNKDITIIIKETTQSVINIFGVIIFFNILISLLSVFINKQFLFFIEITNGFNIISTIKANIIKNFLIIFLNSFGGIAIFFQIKSINNDANYFLIIKKFFISFLISIITYLVIILFKIF